MQRWRDHRSRTHGALSTFHDSTPFFNWSLASSTTHWFFFLLSAVILFVEDHVRVIVIKAAKRLCWHLLLISHSIFLSLGLYLNYTHVSYFTVVSPITCLMRSRRIQRRTIRIIFPNFKYSSALREAGIPALYDRREKQSYDILKDIVCNKDHKLPSLSISLSIYQTLQLKASPMHRLIGIPSSFCRRHKYLPDPEQGRNPSQTVVNEALSLQVVFNLGKDKRRGKILTRMCRTRRTRHSCVSVQYYWLLVVYKISCDAYVKYCEFASQLW